MLSCAYAVPAAPAAARATIMPYAMACRVFMPRAGGARYLRTSLACPIRLGYIEMFFARNRWALRRSGRVLGLLWWAPSWAFLRRLWGWRQWHRRPLVILGR